MNRLLAPAFVVCILMASCTGEATPMPARDRAPVSEPTRTFPALAAAPVSHPTATQKPKQYSPITPVPSRTITPTPVPPTTEADASAWKSLPVIPEAIDPGLQKVY